LLFDYCFFTNGHCDQLRFVQLTNKVLTDRLFYLVS